MRKILFVFAFFAILLFAKVAFADETALVKTSTTSGVRPSIKTSVEANLTENLRQRAKTEIARRLNFLNDLLTKLTNIKKISDSDKASLQSQIQTQIDGLNALQTKIDADTDITTLRTDVKSIINGYYIFAFFRVKVSLLFATDRSLTVVDSMTMLSTKLKTRIDQAQSSGKDVTTLNSLLTDMNSKILDAKTQFQAVQTELNGLDATGYPGNKSTLLDARKKLKAGAEDLRAAYKDAIKIRQGLGKVGEKVNNSSSSSASENLTPTPTTSL